MANSNLTTAGSHGELCQQNMFCYFQLKWQGINLFINSLTWMYSQIDKNRLSHQARHEAFSSI